MDTKLNREVAIRILPRVFALDPAYDVAVECTGALALRAFLSRP